MRLGGVAHAHLIGLTCGMSGPRACYRAQVRMKGPRAPPIGLTCAVTNERATTATNQSNFACNSLLAISNFEFVSLELQRFWALLKVHAIELHAKFVLRWSCRHPRVSRPPFGTAAWPSGSSGTLHTCGAGVLLCRLARYLPRVRYKILPARLLGGENGTKLSLHA